MSKCIRTCLGENIRRFRNQHRLTQREFAQKTGLSLSFLQNVETGKRWVSPEKIAVIATALGVTESELFQDCDTATSMDPKATLALICEAFGVELGVEQLQMARIRIPQGIPPSLEKEFHSLCRRPEWDWAVFQNTLESLKSTIALKTTPPAKSTKPSQKNTK